MAQGIARRFQLIASALMLFVLAGCGFQPLYAVDDSPTGRLTLRDINLAAVLGSNSARPFVEDAFSRYRPTGETAPQYDLIIDAQETAAPLAVQLDATVTRYTYNLIARYELINRKTGKKLNGKSQALASFNVVTSQYSTLFAERAAREKAADELVLQLEREILLQLKKQRENAAKKKKKKENPAPDELPTDS